MKTARDFDKVMEGSAQAHDEVLGGGNGFARYGHNALGDGISESDRAVNGGEGCNVENGAADGRGKRAGGNLTLRKRLNQLLFGALRITGGQNSNFNAVMILLKRPDRLDALFFVVFNGDHRAFGLDDGFEDFHTGENLLGRSS